MGDIDAKKKRTRAKCRHCNVEMDGRPDSMRLHVTQKCMRVSVETRKIWVRRVGERMDVDNTSHMASFISSSTMDTTGKKRRSNVRKFIVSFFLGIS